MLSEKIVQNLRNGSWIRAMFEEGARLRQAMGADKVFDFTLGNPDPEPPAAVREILKKFVLEETPGIHKYMSNAGYPDVREKIAKKTNHETGLSLTQEHIIMTCGAAGGLNVILKTILNPGEEVIVLTPFFVEYNFYIENHGGKIVKVNTIPDSFQPDVEALKNAISSRTKAIIVNTPNNPTGVVYSEENLKKMAEVVDAKEKEYNSTIFVISDEPYNKLVYDGVKIPNLLNIFTNSLIVNSYSKSLSLPGERIGYIAVNPGIKDVSLMVDAMVFANRTLGYVNAPSIFQKVIAESLDEVVDTEIYKVRRDMLYNNLIKYGFTCVKPEGAFYLFPKSPIEDDVSFVKSAVKYGLLLVPGSGFGAPGYFRIAYCVSIDTVKNSIPAFEAIAKEYKLI